MLVQDEQDRLRRLHVVQRDLDIEDDVEGGGQQANEKGLEMRNLQEYAKRQKDRIAAAEDLVKRRAAAEREGQELAEEDNELMQSFKAAAENVQKQRIVDKLEPVDQVADHLKGLLDEWDKELESKPEEWIYTLEGRQAVANLRICRSHMKPLFKRIRKRELPGDIERALYLIVQAMKKRNYREAADVYVGLAIGNAPWPIGVTMIGIHERSAREKIFAQSQAHAMHDEETRKYLQSVKRLITYSQRIYPTVPSLSLDFNSGFNGWDKDQLLIEDTKQDIRQSVPALKALPMANNGTGKLADGWRGQDSDTRTWKGLLTHAYGTQRNASERVRITTATEELLKRDKTMYDDKSGHLTSKKRMDN